VAIGVGSGGQDAQGAERGREYDTVSGAYAEWVEHEVLPRAETAAGVRLTHDPNGRATMGISSSGVAAFTMAWFHPELYGLVLAYSPTVVNQQWPHDPALPGGAWEYHSAWPGLAKPDLMVHGVRFGPTSVPVGAPLIPNTPRKPIRIWFETGDHDLFYPVVTMADGMHDWVLANENFAQALAGKGYDYQFTFARNAGHVDKAVVAQTLPEALEWVWRGYKN
jgi:S-formylglutathione hydrolase FrmB